MEKKPDTGKEEMSEEPFTFPGFLESQNIKLLPANKKNINQFADWFNDAKVRIYSRNATPMLAAHMEEWFVNLSPSNDAFRFEIWYKGDEKIIGDVGIMNIDYSNGTAWLGLGIGAKEYWGKGLASEASRLIYKFAFEELNLRKVMAGIFAPNKGSQGAAKKSGMSLEAILKEDFYLRGVYGDTTIYSIFKEDYFSQQQTD